MIIKPTFSKHIKLDIFLTYHVSWSGDPSDRVLEDQSADARGTLACSIYRCFELI